MIKKTRLGDGAVLLEPVEEEFRLPAPEVFCAPCWRSEGKKQRAVVALGVNPIRFVAIDADLEEPFMGLCSRHAKKAQKEIKQRVRKMRRFTTNLYAH